MPTNISNKQKIVAAAVVVTENGMRILTHTDRDDQKARMLRIDLIKIQSRPGPKRNIK